jgi:DNA-binding LytR/AlgR family response regulator
MRVHRNWLINPSRVVELERDAGETTLFVGVVEGTEKTGVRVPVAKERAVEVRDALLAGTRGIRQM